MSKYIGDVSAYAYAVSKGYTGTEEEFAELMADYADVGQRAEDAAESALNSKTAAQTAAQTATTKASEASTSATSASSSASAASASASQASGSATSAANSATAASGSATSAAGSATTATTKASEASASATAAQTAQTAAEAAQTAAETAQGKAEDAQAAAETTAQSISASATQIATNAADITQLKSEVSALPTDGVVANSKQLLSENGTDNAEPYMFRAVPVNADRAELDAVVGGTVVWNQLAGYSAPDTPTTINGVTFTPNGDGSVTVSGTATAQTLYNYGVRISYPSNHKRLMKGCPSGGGTSTYRFKDGYASTSDTGNGLIETVNSDYSVAQIIIANGYTANNLKFTPQIFDLTAMFGTTIADYIYQLGQSTAGAGVAFFRKLFPKDYYPYDAGTLKSVEGVSEKVTRDADNNVLGTYPLDSTLTLRGIPKLADGKLSYDGDRYLPDGTVERRYGIRAYQSGDESLADATTDGTNTVYKLTTPTTETADPYQSLQVCDPNGTEEFVTTGIVSVGHETRYPENLRAKIEGLPWDFSSLIAPTEKTTKASRNYTTGALLIMNNVLYKVTANIANGGTITPGTNVTATTLSEVISALQ